MGTSDARDRGREVMQPDRAECLRSAFLKGAATPVSPLSATRIIPMGDHAIENVREVEDDMDAATPVDAQNAPTGVWKSR